VRTGFFFFSLRAGGVGNFVPTSRFALAGRGMKRCLGGADGRVSENFHFPLARRAERRGGHGRGVIGTLLIESYGVDGHRAGRDKGGPALGNVIRRRLPYRGVSGGNQ